MPLSIGKSPHNQSRSTPLKHHPTPSCSCTLNKSAESNFAQNYLHTVRPQLHLQSERLGRAAPAECMALRN